MSSSAQLSFVARGAVVRVLGNDDLGDRALGGGMSLEIQYSPLAQAFHESVVIPFARLRGWLMQMPDECSTGFVDLLWAVGDDIVPLAGAASADVRVVRVSFSAGQQQEFLALHQWLLAAQAGHSPLREGSVASAGDAQQLSLDDWLGGSTQAESPAEASADVALDVAVDNNAGAGGAASGRKRAAAPWSKIATPDVVPEPNADADPSHPLFGQVVCVTGDVEPLSKGDVWNLIAAHGGTVSKSVTKKTTVLVIGEWASMTSKEKRARELRDKGQEIALLPLSDFLQQVGQ